MQPLPIEIQYNGMAIGDRKDPLPSLDLSDLKTMLTYDHRIFKRGRDAYTAGGGRQPVEIVPTQMYQMDGHGRIITKVGFFNAIAAFLRQRGYSPYVVDLNPAHPRPDRFKTNWDGVFETFRLKARQDVCLANIADNPYGGTVEAPPGFGKSWLFRALGVLYPRANILYTVTRKDVAEELFRGLTAHFPNVGRFGDGRKSPGRLIVSTAQSLHHVELNDIDIHCGDEAHELLTDNYAERLAALKWARNYAFTATPRGRADGADPLMEFLFGPIIFKLSFQEAVELELIVPIRVEWVDVFMERNPCAELVDTAKHRNGIWRNEFRNVMIAEKALSYPETTQTLIMVKTLEHACYLKKFLPEYTLAYSEGGSDTKDDDIRAYQKIGLISQDEPRMDWQRRQTLKEQFSNGTLKKVIATDVWSTGVNFHQLQVLIRADAARSVIRDTQIPGRVTRPDGVKDVGILVDMRDQFDPSFYSAAQFRARNYDANGWEQNFPSGSSKLRRK
jgi:superfamily II DNA or RNA helicase